jgi:hypothetical protein
MSDFSLMDAIECGIVQLPRVAVADNLHSMLSSPSSLPVCSEPFPQRNGEQGAKQRKKSPWLGSGSRHRRGIENRLDLAAGKRRVPDGNLIDIAMKIPAGEYRAVADRKLVIVDLVRASSADYEATVPVQLVVAEGIVCCCDHIPLPDERTRIGGVGNESPARSIEPERDSSAGIDQLHIQIVRILRNTHHVINAAKGSQCTHIYPAHQRAPAGEGAREAGVNFGVRGAIEIRRRGVSQIRSGGSNCDGRTPR